MKPFKLYDYDTDREWSDRLNPVVDGILASHVIRQATQHEDTKQATDKVSVPKAIAVRVREYRFWLNANFRGEFTIRLARRTGARTEFEKIEAGRGDWFFYGFASNDNTAIPNWRLIDLNSFRTHWRARPKGLQWGDKDNGDGTKFRWFQVASFPQKPPIQIAASQELATPSKELEMPPMFPGWDREVIQQQGGTVTKREFEEAAIRYARQGPRDDSEWRYKGPFLLPEQNPGDAS